MILSHKETIKKEVDKVDFIVCNFCGTKVSANSIDINLFHEWKIKHGYGSPKDTATTTIHACEYCIDNWLDSCSIEPTVEELGEYF
jgi:hypothetical protein